jgi:hypothetical protein
MASVLSLRPQSPFKRSFSDNPYLRSYSPLKDQAAGALRDITTRNASACSLYTLPPIAPGQWLNNGENTPPPLASRSLLDLSQVKGGHGPDVDVYNHVSRKRNCSLNRPAPSFLRVSAPSEPLSKKRREGKQSTHPSVCTPATDNDLEINVDDHKDAELFDLYDAIHVPLPEARFSENTDREHDIDIDDIPLPVEPHAPPYRRWMSTLKRRHVHRGKEPVHKVPLLRVDNVEADVSMLCAPADIPESLRRESMSSSLGCVTAMQSAAMTVASGSIAPRSVSVPPKDRLGHRSSNFSENRKSTDSTPGVLGPILDERAWLRSIQRRRVVEEIIASEESYIGDLKVLTNVCYALTSWTDYHLTAV